LFLVFSEESINSLAVCRDGHMNSKGKQIAFSGAVFCWQKTKLLLFER
jgi:hypothetical protein